MGTYAVGNATKERIRSAARGLFYARGISAVTDSEICREAGIQRGLVGYHFGNRGALVASIYAEYVEALRDTVQRRFPTDDPALSYCILEHLLVEMLFRNTQMRRFYVDLFRFKEAAEEEVRVQHEQMERILTHEGNELDVEQLKIAVTISQGTFNELIRCVDIGYLDGDIEKAIETDLHVALMLIDMRSTARDQLIAKTADTIRGYKLATGKAMKPRIIGG